MKILKVVESADKRVHKYVYQLDDSRVVEASAIKRTPDGKLAICLPTQTGCAMRCKFCHLTSIPQTSVRNLSKTELTEIINNICNTAPNQSETLLISFMGSGEPLRNQHVIIEVSNEVRYTNKKYRIIKTAFSTMAPSLQALKLFASNVVSKHQSPFKMHVSLHATDIETRRELIPGSTATPNEIVEFLRLYNERFLGPVELHYTLIAGVNDSNQDLAFLVEAKLPICFIEFNEGVNDFRASPRLSYFVDTLKSNGIEVESYAPPGADIGASCGQFDLKYYGRT